MAHPQASCIEACNTCAIACSQCATACLSQSDPMPMARSIQLDMDCAAICRLAADAMARGSEHASAICELCAVICDSCGEECVQYQLPQCQVCAMACKRCAQECRSMSMRQQATGNPLASRPQAH